MASGRGRDGGRALSGPDLPLAALSPIVARPHPGARRHYLWVSKRGSLRPLSLAPENPRLAFLRLPEPLPLFVAPVMARIDTTERARTAARDQGFGLRPVHVVLHALQDLAIGNAGRGEEDIVTADQVIDAQHSIEVGAGSLGLLLFFGVAGVELALNLSAQAFERRRGQHGLG